MNGFLTNGNFGGRGFLKVGSGCGCNFLKNGFLNGGNGFL